MHTFGYGFLKNICADSDIINRVMNIGVMNERTKGIRLDHPQTALAMEKNAVMMSVIDSNAIEGIFTSMERITGLINGRTAPIGHNEEEIVGYRDALKHIHSEHQKIRLNKEWILELYGILMSHTLIEGLEFKDRDNIIVERGGDGKIVKVHETVPADFTEEYIDQLLASYWEARNDVSINKLLLIPCFVMDFLRIHPFRDGNGRMSRLMTVLLLYQEGYDICRYVSMESKINGSKDRYYDALELSEEGWFEDANDYMPFISYFLDQLFLCYRELDKSLKASVGDRTRSDAIEAFLRICIIPVSKSELCGMFPDLSETTIERKLNDLMKEGRIERIGKSRGTRYIGIR